MGIVVVVVGASIINVKMSVVGARSEREIIEMSAKVGDYETAKELYGQCQVTPCHEQVLGAETELEDLVYPEQKLAREIARWEGALKQYPSNREIMRGLASLYEQAGESERAEELREQSRILDPNE